MVDPTPNIERLLNVFSETHFPVHAYASRSHYTVFSLHGSAYVLKEATPARFDESVREDIF